MTLPRYNPERIPISVFRRVLFGLITIIGFFLVLEYLLYLCGFEYVGGQYNIESRLAVEPHWLTRGLIRDPSMPWSWIPGPGMTATQPLDNSFTYNRDGFIGPEITLRKSPDVYRVICMGDSVTLGWNSPPGTTYPDYLRIFLNLMSPGMFQVINAGVSGYSSFQGLHDFDQRISRWEPDILVVSYNWNDHGDAPDQAGLSIRDLTSDHPQFPDKDQPRGTLITARSIPFQKMRSVQLVYQLHDKIVWTIHSREDASRSASSGTSPTSSPRKAGTGLRRVSPDDYRPNLTAFTQIADSRDCAIIFMTQPANPVQHRDAEPWITYYQYQDEYNTIMREVAQSTGSLLADAAADEGIRATMFYDHVHMGPEGNRHLAEIVMKQIMKCLLKTNPG
ncbi:SGNH/GDSL hydrolase family protein [bacterium]|nr:SGNH/GDSL hydrolase family protein [candidate division CSSED10-310 bacterium]